MDYKALLSRRLQAENVRPKSHVVHPSLKMDFIVIKDQSVTGEILSFLSVLNSPIVSPRSMFSHSLILVVLNTLILKVWPSYQ